MALTATTSDVRLSGAPNMYTVTAHLVLHDDVLVANVIDADFSADFSTNIETLTEVRTRLGLIMQAAIDDYKVSDALVGTAAKAAAIVWWNANLTA